MKRDSLSGLALIVGSLGSLVTMAFHPSAHSLEALARQAGTARWTHSLALASVPITFLGFLGLCHRLRAAAVLAPAALTAFGFGSVAVASAAVLNGFGAPALAVHFAEDPAARQAVEAVLVYNSLLNSGFAKVFMMASATATVLWSWAILTAGTFPRWVGTLGGLLGVAGLIGVLTGHLTTTVHSFGLFVLGLSAWTILLGVLLLRAPSGSQEI